YADYLVLQLQLFKAQQRGGSGYAHIMRRVAAGLSVAQMRDVARYYASLTPEPLQGEPGEENAKDLLVIPNTRDTISTSLDHAHFTVALHAGELDSLDVFNTLLAQLR
ncbi:MAG: c-type cytochrome, partial [Gammaproteobacteria bacterium]